MKQRHASQEHPTRRSRNEIDRNYFFGDVFIKTGVAAGVAIGLIALVTPFTVAEAFADGMYGYLAVMAAFGLLGLAAFALGRHLRREATHWDID
jgi:hypothetical protein